MTEQKKGSRFLVAFLLYLLLLALLLGAVLLVFRDFLTRYEATRPARAIEQYRQELKSSDLGERCRDALSKLDAALQDEAEVLSIVADRLENARIVEDVADSDEERRVYRILSEDTECGSLTLKRGPAQRYGFAPWTVAGERYDFSPWFHTLNVTVPENYSVRCANQELGRSYIVERDIRYEALSACYEFLEGLPTMVRYETGPLLTDSKLSVYDPEGTPVPPARQNETSYLDTCSREQREKMQRFAEAFLPYYLGFTSYRSQYNALKSFTVPDSPFARRLYLAISNSFFSVPNYSKLLSMECTHYVDLGDRLLLELRYEVETTPATGREISTSGAWLLLREQADGALKISNLIIT